MLREDFLGIIIYLHLPFTFHTATLKAKIDTADPGKQTAERDRVHPLPLLRFLPTGFDFGRPRPGRSWLSLWRWFTASKIKCAIVQPFASAILDHAAQTSGGWIMFLRIVIVSPR
jgi:hypothetical protein